MLIAVLAALHDCLLCSCLYGECTTFGLHYLLGSDVMQFVVLHLFLPSSCGFIDGLLHATGDTVGIHNHFTMHVAGSTAGGLRKTTVIAKKTLFICV